MIYFVQMITCKMAYLSHAASSSVLDNDEILFHLLISLVKENQKIRSPCCLSSKLLPLAALHVKLKLLRRVEVRREGGWTEASEGLTSRNTVCLLIFEETDSYCRFPSHAQLSYWVTVGQQWWISLSVNGLSARGFAAGFRTVYGVMHSSDKWW